MKASGYRASEPGVGPDEADKIMHGQLTTPAGFTLMETRRNRGSLPNSASSPFITAASPRHPAGQSVYW